MKTKLLLTVILTSFIFLTGCSNDSIEEPVALSKRSSNSGGSSEIHRVYPKEEAEVLATFGAIGTSIVNGAGQGYDGPYMDELISFHAYGPKFVEFNGGQSFDSAGNEHNERQFGVVLKEGGVIQFAAKPGTLKVAVYYGNIANVTFISDFIMDFKDYGEITIENLITLLFVKTKGEWKMVHEHHSPLNNDNPVLNPNLVFNDFVVDPIYEKEQGEVIATFGAIGESITKGAGHGKDGPYMDELISYHAYGKKFVEFNNGLVYDSAGNEFNERKLFGDDLVIGGVKQFAPVDKTLQVAVYNGKVANVTFISDFKLMFKGNDVVTPVNNLITLLFVKVKGEWKMVHEHHSPVSL